jgi:hypothetical protein
MHSAVRLPSRLPCLWLLFLLLVMRTQRKDHEQKGNCENACAGHDGPGYIEQVAHVSWRPNKPEFNQRANRNRSPTSCGNGAVNCETVEVKEGVGGVKQEEGC